MQLTLETVKVRSLVSTIVNGKEPDNGCAVNAT